MHIMLILCKSRERESILDELEDWKGEGAQVFLSGITNKTNDGFIFLEWGKPIPETFHQKLRGDEDIIDYLVIGSNITTVTTPQPA